MNTDAASPDVALSPVTSLVNKVRAGYAPPPKLTVSEFADAHIIVTSGPLSGTKWQTAFAPYQRGIMDAFHEPGVQTAVVMGSSQWGKTACAVNVVAYHMAHDPCPILVVLPTLDPMAKEFSVNRLEPVIEATPILKEKTAKKRKRNQTNTTYSKTFTGGSVNMAGANSAASLASRPVRVLVLDEIDRYPAELPGEGSTLSIAMKRTTTYRQRRRQLLTSSPTIEDGPIHSWYQRGDQRKYFVPCPACDHMHAFEWKNVKWEDDDPATARLQCPACDYAISDAERIAILSRGEWRPTHPRRRDKSIVSFHIWEAYSPLSSLTEIVRLFISAREAQKAGDHAEMHTWQNTTLGEPVSKNAGVAVKSDALLARKEVGWAGREGPSADVDVPPSACCLTMGVDTQDDRLELLIVGWGPGEEAWLVDRATLPGDPQYPEVWEELDKVLAHPYRHASGQTLLVQATCIDSAGHRTNYVYDYCEKRSFRKVFATIGRDGQRPIVSSPSPRRWGRDEREVPLYTIGVDAAKSLWMDRLKLTVKGAGYVHLPEADWCDQELVDQLTSEKLVRVMKKGTPVMVWKKTRTRNEMLDCAVGAIAAMRLLNPKLTTMLEMLNREAAAAAAAATKTRTPGPDGTIPPAPPRPTAPTQGRRVIRSNYLRR